MGSADAEKVTDFPVYAPHITELLMLNDQSLLQNAIVSINDSLIKGRQVLVCCEEGKDQSAVVIAAYLMKKYGVTVERAVNFIKNKRPFVTEFAYEDFLTKDFKLDFPFKVEDFFSYVVNKS